MYVVAVTVMVTIYTPIIVIAAIGALVVMLARMVVVVPLVVVATMSMFPVDDAARKTEQNRKNAESRQPIGGFHRYTPDKRIALLA
jgi:nitrate/nitrite transporter NarK